MLKNSTGMTKCQSSYLYRISRPEGGLLKAWRTQNETPLKQPKNAVLNC